MKTCLCMILDESGSMGGNEDAVVEGFNALLDDQLKNKGETNFYFLKFNHNVTKVYDNLPLPKVPRMTRGLYRPYGRTALYDAIAEGIKIVEKNVDSADRVIVVIFTDGKENGSRYSNDAKCKEFLAKFQSTGHWSFLYIGEDSKEFAEKMDIPLGNTIDFRHGNIKANFEAASHACSTLMASDQKQAHNLLEDFSRTEDPKEVVEEVIAKKKEKEQQAAPPPPPPAPEPVKRQESVDIHPEREDDTDDTVAFVKDKVTDIRKFAKKSLINLLLLLFALFTFYYFFPYCMAVIIVVLVMDFNDMQFEGLKLPVNDKKK